MITKTSKIMATLLTVSFLITSVHFPLEVARAQNNIFNNPGLSMGTCTTGERDWSSFISSVISYDDFVEYWKDILVRYNTNSCLYADINNLLQQIDKVRKQLRLAFLACDSRAASLKATYYQLEAELFFLRKFIKPTNGQLLVASDQEIYNQLRSYFVINKSFFTEEQAKKMFDQFKAKYSNRVETYTNCSDATWTNLIAKWNELKENVQSGFGAKEASESISTKFEKAINAPVKRTGNLLGGLLDARINGVEPEATLSDLAAELKKNAPNGFTFDQLQAAKDREHQRYQNDLEYADYLGQYEHLYKESSSDSIANITSRLKTLEVNITQTYPYINQTYQCTKGILDRAC